MEKLLFEIGTEEIPAKFMPGILAQLQELAAKKMTELRIPFEGVKVYGTPRRMTFIASGVAEAQADSTVEAKGPSAKIAFVNGEPSKAALGFARGQGVENVYDVKWVDDITYGDFFHTNEVEQSYYNFQIADTALLFDLFEKYEAEAKRVIELGYIRPAYDYVLKCSHTFNLLDSRGAISVSERTAYIGRVRAMARLCAAAYVEQREKMGFPLLKKGENK